MFKKKTESYWLQFSVYQTYQSQEQLFSAVSSLVSEYDLPESAVAVLNTLKLHAQTFYGVCWLKVAEIAKKARLSISTVHRVLKLLRDNGVISIFNKTNTKRGGKAPNVYVINNLVDNTVDGSVDNSIEPSYEPSDDSMDEPSDDISVGTPQALSQQAETPVSPAHSNSNTSPYSSSNINPDRKIKDEKTNQRLVIPESFDNESYEQQLKDIPQEFINIFKPYYGNAPDIIVKRWRTAQKACKHGATSMEYVYWETIKDAWLVTVRAYKAGKVRDASDNGLGGYFYSTLCEMATNDYMDYLRENVWSA